MLFDNFLTVWDLNIKQRTIKIIVTDLKAKFHTVIGRLQFERQRTSPTNLSRPELLTRHGDDAAFARPLDTGS